MTDPLILLVEDDAVIREATQLNLERNGFRVITASGGLTGMDLAVDAKPDIAVLDVMLPDLNGISLCRRIREELSVPVIMLSARDDPVDIVLGLKPVPTTTSPSPSTAVSWWPVSEVCSGGSNPIPVRRKTS